MTPSEQRNMILAVGGGAIVLIVAVSAALLLGRSPPSPPGQKSSASSSGLQVQLGRETRVDPNAPLRCFVNGQYVGMETTARCAQKNGVAPGALDVGVDASGALAAASGGAADLKPLPVEGQVSAPPARVADAARPSADGAPDPASGGEAGECLRYGGSGWRGAGSMVLSACVRTLFNGRCLDPGEAIYGRWGGQTLRLQPGRVEVSGDNQSFRTLARQAVDCSFPAL